MVRLHNEIMVKASPEAVWGVVGNLADAASWVPGVTAARLDGERRVCSTSDGGEIEEEITAYSAEQRRYDYRHVRVPLPVTSSRGTLSVASDPAGARVIWDAELDPLDPSQADGLWPMVDAAYKEALDRLRHRIEG